MHKQIINYINQYLLPCYVDKLYFIEKLNVMLDKKEHVSAILMDPSKAFDTINYERLVRKLNAY